MKEETRIKSSNGHDSIYVTVWLPECEPVGVLQIAHGMCEFIDRYAPVAEYFNSKGFVVVGNDHIGHGKTAPSADKLGIFDAPELSAVPVRDMKLVTDYAKEKFPNLPYWLLGHSMGSFFSRRYTMEYGEGLSGVIFMGSGSQSPGLLKTVVKVFAGMEKLLGGDFRLPGTALLSKMGYNKKIKTPQTPVDWLSVDRENINFCTNHPFCNIKFSIKGYRILFDAISFIQNPENIKKLPADLPILLISGKEDPVGNFGADIPKIAEEYKKICSNVEYKQYPGLRHEIHCDISKEQVFDDLWSFVFKNT